jgi:hypothetical protein
MMRLVLAMREAREAMQAGKVNDYAAAFSGSALVLRLHLGNLKALDKSLPKCS